MAIKVYLGAGHGKVYPGGGYDPGAVAGPLREEALTEQVVTAAAAALKRCGFSVLADTRAEQYDYVQAAAAANSWGADWACEVHFNATTAHTSHGTEAIVQTGARDTTIKTAESVGKNVAAALGLPWRTVLQRDTLHFNKATKMASAILEVAFIDADQAAFDATWVKDAGEGFAKGLCAAYAVKYVPPPAPPPPPPVPSTAKTKATALAVQLAALAKQAADLAASL